jgi:uncharacterized protein
VSAFASALYPGVVTHHRRRPREHRLTYRIWSMLIDLDEMEALDRQLRWFSLDRFNLVAFRQRDRGAGSGDLRNDVRNQLRDAGLPADGPIRFFTMPRVLGQAFNPLSIYFCHHRNGDIAAILWEVDNTFGERHAYLIPAIADEAGVIRQACGKDFFVSPFMDMNLTYRFRVRTPGEHFALQIEVDDAVGLILSAHHVAARQTLSDGALLGLALAAPLQALAVLGGIHWEALKLWLKGVKLRVKPAPPTTPITVTRPATQSEIRSTGIGFRS